MFAVIRLEETKMIVILSAGFFLSMPDKQMTFAVSQLLYGHGIRIVFTSK